jgi:hypothetical protein
VRVIVVANLKHDPKKLQTFWTRSCALSKGHDPKKLQLFGQDHARYRRAMIPKSCSVRISLKTQAWPRRGDQSARAISVDRELLAPVAHGELLRERLPSVARTSRAAGTAVTLLRPAIAGATRTLLWSAFGP